MIVEEKQFELVIGIEVHAQLKTKTKLFGGSSTQFGKAPNQNVDPVCLGLPGALPVLNEEAIKLAVLAGFATNCKVRQKSVFSRKNYFYPDLPKGYQISQFDEPICEHGFLDIECANSTKKIGITRIHMEEDAGKLLHQGSDSIEGSSHSLVDLNRAGTPLIEIVSEPDIRTAEEARVYVETLRSILIHIDVCDGNMEEGSLRADVNISLRPEGSKTFGTRTEIKNLNSFRSIERAIKAEMKRQTRILLDGGKITQETRNYDDTTQTTSALRGKEDAHDYRYFPEPDLPPLLISDEQLESLKNMLPELPKNKKTRYIDTLDLSPHDCKVLLQDIAMDRYFNKTLLLLKTASAKDLANWIVGDINAALKEKEGSFETIKTDPKEIADMVDAIKNGTISGKMGKDVIEKLLTSTKTTADIIKKLGGSQISDQSELTTILQSVLAANQDVVEKVKSGKSGSINFLIGQVMKETKGRAKPDTVKELLLAAIS